MCKELKFIISNFNFLVAHRLVEDKNTGVGIVSWIPQKLKITYFLKF